MSEPRKNNNIEPNNKLSILIGQDGLSFCVSNLKRPKITRFEEKNFEKRLKPDDILKQIELFLSQNEIDLNIIEKAQVLFTNSMYSFVPQPFFDEKHLSEYLKFNTKILPTDFIAYDELTPQELNNVYIPYTNINNYFFDKFGTFQYEHATSVLVENMLRLENETPEEERIYVNVYHRHFDMVIVKDNKLMLCNTFAFDTPEDFAYYILFVAEQLKLDPEKFPLIFLGRISETSENYKICYRYIKNCSFLKDEPSLQKEFDRSKFPQSKPNYVLLKTHICA